MSKSMIKINQGKFKYVQSINTSFTLIKFLNPS